MNTHLKVSFDELISPENLLEAWSEFIKGKRGKQDVLAFQFRLMENVFALHQDLKDLTYRHGGYHAFRINDPKPRSIHKATVRDRLLHHATHRILYPFFDRIFIADSFSCRNGKGTHAALERFRRFIWTVSRNNTRTCWVLKCDIRKFFDHIDHLKLFHILERFLPDLDILWLIAEVVGSFKKTPGVGLPLGNVTSQLFVNVYMNEFDQFVKHRLQLKHYLRYADDFVVLSRDREWLFALIPVIAEFLRDRLALQLHPNKVSLTTIASGVDFLGWVNFPTHRVLRTTTKRRMVQRLRVSQRPETIASYRGLLSYGATYKIRHVFDQFTRRAN